MSASGSPLYTLTGVSAEAWSSTPPGQATRPAGCIAASARVASSPPTVNRAAFIPDGANVRAAASTSSVRPSTAASAPSSWTRATPSAPEATASTRAPIRLASCTAT